MKNDFFHKQTNHDGRPILEIKSLADIEILQGYRERKENVRIVINPHTCTDKYEDLLKAVDNLSKGVTTKTALISFKKELKN